MDSLLQFAGGDCDAMVSLSKNEAKGHSLGVGIEGHAHGWYIQQDDAAFYGITSISCLKFTQFASKDNN